MSGYYCEHCEKPFSHKERHHCEGTCSYCYRSNDKYLLGQQKHCSDCGRTFRNADCYDCHKRPNKTGRTICERVFVCKTCAQFVSLLKAKRDEKHQCGTVRCKTCETWVDQGSHKCFLQPAPNHLSNSRRDRVQVSQRRRADERRRH